MGPGVCKGRPPARLRLPHFGEGSAEVRAESPGILGFWGFQRRGSGPVITSLPLLSKAHPAFWPASKRARRVSREKLSGPCGRALLGVRGCRTSSCKLGPRLGFGAAGPLRGSEELPGAKGAVARRAGGADPTAPAAACPHELFSSWRRPFREKKKNASSFLQDLNFADELPYSGCLATKFKQG